MNTENPLDPANLAPYAGGMFDWTCPESGQQKKMGVEEVRMLQDGSICIKGTWVAHLEGPRWQREERTHPLILCPGNINDLQLEYMGSGRIKFKNGNLPRSLLQPNRNSQLITFDQACGLSGTS